MLFRTKIPLSISDLIICSAFKNAPIACCYHFENSYLPKNALVLKVYKLPILEDSLTLEVLLLRTPKSR
jgi:hypothetical protein